MSTRIGIAIALIALYGLAALPGRWKHRSAAEPVDRAIAAAKPATPAPTAAPASRRPLARAASAQLPTPPQHRTPVALATQRPAQHVALHSAPGEPLIELGSPLDLGSVSASDQGTGVERPRDEPDRGEVLQRMQALWEAERDDPEWTGNERAAAGALLELFALPQELLLDVSCRTTVCRITLDARDVSRLLNIADHVRTEQYPIEVKLGPRESKQAFAYLARDGFEQELLGRLPAGSEVADER